MPLWMLLLCVAVQLCCAAQPVDEVITAKNVPLLGDWIQRSPDSPEVQEAAQQAVKMFNANSKNKRMFRLVAVTAAQSQVTNKINFRIQAVLGKTACLKAEDLDLSSCPGVRKQLSCRFQVTFDPRNQKHELQDHQCRKLKED
eukprot:XP_003965642.1 PREDICTED: cystatin-M-like isoform X1 [Takifugu rubripes]